jgi:hypothetical protein
MPVAHATRNRAIRGDPVARHDGELESTLPEVHRIAEQLNT